MQGTSVLDRELLDTTALCGHLVPAGSVYAFLAAHRHRLFPDALFADLFPSGRGRPSVPADVIAAAFVLKELEGLSDRQAAAALSRDIAWKAACGLALDAEAFDASVFVYWRRRLNASERPHRIDTAVKDVAKQTGILNGRSRRALDSTVLDDAVATQDTVTQLVAAIRKVRKLVPEARDVHVAGFGDELADLADRRDQLRDRVLRGDRIIEHRGVQRPAGPTVEYPGLLGDVLDRSVDAVRPLRSVQPAAPVHEHARVERLSI